MVERGRVLVTGGAGFLGSWLCDSLVEEDHKTICVDNLSSGVKNNVAHLVPDPKFEFIKHDVKEPLEIEEPVDYVFHLASRASPVDFERYPLDILLTNSLGTYNMLELARKINARFLLASSSEIYGDPRVHPQHESYQGDVNPVGPRSCYDESKRFSESLSINYRRKYELDVRIARIFNTFGPRMRPDDGRVISTFIIQALKNEPIVVYGDGTQTRSFCYVTDMTNGLKRLMFADNLEERVVNLGSPDEITILEVANLIKKLTNSNSEIKFGPLPENDPKRRNPDISRARNLLGWSPAVSLEEGLHETVQYFRSVV